MNNFSDKIPRESFRMDRIDLHGTESCPAKHVALLGEKVCAERSLREIRYHLSGYLWGNRHEPVSFSYPADWREAFKDRWFPAWAKRRWPVSLTVRTITLESVYPDFKHPRELGERLDFVRMATRYGGREPE